jgi:putative transposase
MPQSCANILLHLVWSTKGRRPTISTELRPQLHAYLAELVRQTGCTCARVGGTADHVHLAVGLSRTHTVAKLVEIAKSNSSRWMNIQMNGFAWQSGYGVFSVSPPTLEKLEHYIDSQEDHHRKRSFQEEYRALLMLCGVPFDERYVWD